MVGNAGVAVSATATPVSLRAGGDNNGNDERSRFAALMRDSRVAQTGWDKLCPYDGDGNGDGEEHGHRIRPRMASHPIGDDHATQLGMTMAANWG